MSTPLPTALPARSALEHTLRRLWLRRSAGAWLLAPLALLVSAITATRRQLYRWGLLRVERLEATVIVVGNAVVGGAGKTPTVIALVAHLRSQGHAVGVISRGHGRAHVAGVHALEVMPDADPQHVGDEPLLIRQRCDVPVFVGSTRAQAGRALLAQYLDTKIVVCDDGLQHYALYRDVDICVWDDRGWGNGWTLPAGPLREPWPHRAVSACGQSASTLLTLHTGRTPRFAGFRATRRLGTSAYNRSGQRMLLSTLAQQRTLPWLALAGIAQPQAFFDMLQAQGFPIAQTLALPDHFGFADGQLEGLKLDQYQLVCTEKDAHKLWRLAPYAWAVTLEQNAEPAFWQALDQQVNAHTAQKARAKTPHA